MTSWTPVRRLTSPRKRFYFGSQTVRFKGVLYGDAELVEIQGLANEVVRAQLDRLLNVF